MPDAFAPVYGVCCGRFVFLSSQVRKDGVEIDLIA